MADKSITVKLNYLDLPAGLPGAAWEMCALAKCKAAGMPLLGTFLFRGGERGTLIRTEDFEDCGAITYRWKP